MPRNSEINRIAKEIIEKERIWYFNEKVKTGQKDIIKKIIESGLYYLDQIDSQQDSTDEN